MISNRRIAGAYLGVLVALIYGVMTGEFPPLVPGKCRAQNDTFRLLHKVLGVSEWRGPQVCRPLRQHLLPHHRLPHQGGESPPAGTESHDVQENPPERSQFKQNIVYPTDYFYLTFTQWTGSGDTSDPAPSSGSLESAMMKGRIEEREERWIWRN